MKAVLDIRLRRCAGGTVRASGSLAVAPFWCRWDGNTLWFVSSAAAPVGDDDITIDLDVGEGVDASVRTVASTIVYAARGAGTTLRTEIRVGTGATLVWQPEPLIITGRAHHLSSTTIRVDDGGTTLVDEVVVLGRSNETAGRINAVLDLHIGGERAALTSFDTGVPGWSGPGGTGGAKVVATRVLVEPQPARPITDPAADATSAVLRPERGGSIATALGPTPQAARCALERRLGAGLVRPTASDVVAGQTAMAERTSSTAPMPPSPLPVMRPDSNT